MSLDKTLKDFVEGRLPTPYVMPNGARLSRIGTPANRMSISRCNRGLEKGELMTFARHARKAGYKFDIPKDMELTEGLNTWIGVMFNVKTVKPAPTQESLL